jgi:hypothetical protein
MERKCVDGVSVAIKLPIGRAEVSADGNGHAVCVEPSAKPTILASLAVMGIAPADTLRASAAVAA